jgi:hypothetical protein
MTENNTDHRTGDPYRSMLEQLDAAPHAQAREQALRLMLAQAWHEGWETCYNDGGVDHNAYMTGREIQARNEQIKADHDAWVMAQATGARGATYTVERADGSSTSGSWGQL